MLILSLLGGCEDSFDLKSPTSHTPQSRAGQRHTLGPIASASGPARPVSQTPVSDLKVGFIMSGKVIDYGFAYSQNQGLLALLDEFGMDGMVVEDVQEDASAIAAIQKLIDNGCRIIFTPSFGFAPYSAQMAAQYPDIYFFNFAGQGTAPNYSQYFGRMYQARYLTGLVAGLRTESGRIGFVAASPIPQVIRGADAFALGVKQVNPTARVYLEWTNSWDEPALERAAALKLIDAGCDVIAQHQNSVAPQIAAEERGVWSIGYHSSMAFFAPRAYLTGASWNWAPYMIDQVRKINNGTWESSDYWGGLADGVVALDPLSEAVAPGTAKIVEEEAFAIKNGYEVFTGPIYDNQGRLRVPPGRAMTDAEMLALSWLVDNIIVGSAE